MIRIYGASDDLVEIEEDGKSVEELSAYNRERFIHIGEHTHVFARHDGKRRVFWRVRGDHGVHSQSVSLAHARWVAGNRYTIYRVTVRPKVVSK